MSEDYEDDYIPSEVPDYPCPFGAGELVTVYGTLCNTNSSGGTEILEHDGTQCVVTKSFWDYETGWRFHGSVVDDAVVEEFRRQSETGFKPEDYLEKYPSQPQHYERAVAARASFDPGYVYFSEHDLTPSLRLVR